MTDARIVVTLDSSGVESGASAAGDAVEGFQRRASASAAQMERDWKKFSASIDVTTQADRARVAMDNAFAAVEKGGVGAQRSIVETRMRIIDLERSIAKARAIGAPVDPGAIAELNRLQGEVKEVTLELGRYNAMVERTKRDVDDATRANGGLGKGINSLSDLLGIANPKIGEGVAKVGLWAGAAFVATQAVGVLGGVVSDLGKAYNIEGAEEFGGFLKDIASLDFGKAGRSLGDFWAKVTEAPLAELGEATKKVQALADARSRLYGDFGGGGKVGELRKEEAELLAEWDLLQEKGAANAETLDEYSKRAEGLRDKLRALGEAEKARTTLLAANVSIQKQAEQRLRDNAKLLEQERREAEKTREEEKKRVDGLQKLVDALRVGIDHERRMVEAYRKGPDAVKATTDALKFEAELRKNLADVKSPGEYWLVAVLTAAKMQADLVLERTKEVQRILAAGGITTGQVPLIPTVGGVNFALPGSQTPSQLAAAKLDQKLDEVEQRVAKTARTIPQYYTQMLAAAEDYAEKYKVAEEDRNRIIAELHRQYVDEMVSTSQAGLGALQGMIGSLRALGINVSGSTGRAIGQAQAGLQLYQQGTQAWGAMKAMGSATGTSAGGFAAMAAIAALPFVITNLFNQRGRAEASATMYVGQTGVGYDGIGNDKGRGGPKRQVEESIRQIIEYAREFITGLDGQFKSFAVDAQTAAVSIGRNGRSKNTTWWVEYANGLVKDFGKDAQAAMEFATIQAIKSTPTAGLDPIVAAAIQHSTAERLDKFQQQVAAAQAVSMLGYSGEHTSYRQSTAMYHQLAETMKETLPRGGALNEVLRRTGEALDRVGDAEYRRLAGIPETERYTDLLKDWEDYEKQWLEEQRRLQEELRKEREAEAASLALLNQGYKDANGNGVPRWDRGGGGDDGDGWGGDDGSGNWTGANGPGGPGGSGFMPSGASEHQDRIDDIVHQLEELEKRRLTREQVIANAQRQAIGDLLGYLQDDPKYREQIIEWRREENRLVFEQKKLEMQALGIWTDATAALWQAALDAANAQADPRHGRGGGGGAGDDRQSVRDFLRDHEIGRMGNYQGQLASMRDAYRDRRKDAHGDKDLLAQLAQAEEEDRIRLRREARQEHLRPFIGSAANRSEFSGSMAEIEKIYADLRKVREDLGLGLGEINRAEQERLRLLGLEVLGSLGIASAQAKLNYQKQAQDMAFLTENAEKLGLTALEVGDAIGQVQQRNFLDLMEPMAQRLQDEALLAEIAEARWDIERANMLMQIEAAKEFGAITEQQYQRLLAIHGRLPGDLPVGSPANDSYPGVRGGLRDMTSELERAADALKEWREGLLLDEELSPLNPQQRLDESYRQLQDLMARAWNRDAEAAGQLPGAADAYLQILREFTQGGGYYNQQATDLMAMIQRLEEFLRGVPHYAEGGLVDRPHFAMVGDSSEAIIPLRRGRVQVELVRPPESATTAARAQESNVLWGHFWSVPGDVAGMRSDIAAIRRHIEGKKAFDRAHGSPLRQAS